MFKPQKATGRWDEDKEVYIQRNGVKLTKDQLAVKSRNYNRLINTGMAMQGFNAIQRAPMDILREAGIDISELQAMRIKFKEAKQSLSKTFYACEKCAKCIRGRATRKDAKATEWSPCNICGEHPVYNWRTDEYTLKVTKIKSSITLKEARAKINSEFPEIFL